MSAEGRDGQAGRHQRNTTVRAHGTASTYRQTCRPCDAERGIRCVQASQGRTWTGSAQTSSSLAGWSM